MVEDVEWPSVISPSSLFWCVAKWALFDPESCSWLDVAPVIIIGAIEEFSFEEVHEVTFVDAIANHP